MSRAHRPFFRHWLSCVAILLAGFVAAAHAEAPMAQTQVPGYYRMMVGQVEITALQDGALQLDSKRLINGKRKDIEKLLTRAFSPPDKVPLSVNVFLINTGKQLVLVDAGCGTAYGPHMGKLLANLKAAGYDPYQVDAVILTHMHGDHIAGLVDADGQPVFANATVYVEEVESQYWLSASNEAKAPAAWKRIFATARTASAPYLGNGKWKTFKIGSELFPGINTLPARGHTPGHTIVTVESQQQRLMIVGDIVHSHAVQFSQPEVAFDFDVNPRQAVETRRAIFNVLARSKDRVAAAHLPFPGVGRIRAEGAGKYAWVPIEFGAPQ